MNHPTFPKIRTKLGDSGNAEGEWVATEKIHGAQLVVATTSHGIRIGKRKAWLGDQDAFFGWQMIAPQLRESTKNVAAALGTDHVVIYGELCGGAYPHRDVEPVPGLTAVQTGIWYAADLQYAVFDIRISHNGWSEEEDSEFLGYDEVKDVCDESGLLTVPLLGRGRRTDLQQLPIRFPSTLPRALGLPPIDGNCAEGFVLKPARRISAVQRPLVKHKIPEFDDVKFDQSVPFDSDAQLTIGELLQLCNSLVNSSRVASARSKVGTDTTTVRDELILDVLIDLESLFPTRTNLLTDSESRMLQKRLHELAIEHVP